MQPNFMLVTGKNQYKVQTALQIKFYQLNLKQVNNMDTKVAYISVLKSIPDRNQSYEDHVYRQ